MHHTNIEFIKGMVFNANIDSHKILMDTTVENGGSDSGPSPKKLMLASLAGCTGMDVVSILNKMKVEYKNFNIDILASLTDTYPKIYHNVKIIYSIQLAETDKEKMQKAVDLSQKKYCGVSAMFKAFAKIETAITYL